MGLASRELLAGLRRIGIEEIAHRKGHRYLTRVVDQDSGRLVWAAPGRNSDTLSRFFDQPAPAPGVDDARLGRWGAVGPRHRDGPGPAGGCQIAHPLLIVRLARASRFMSNATVTAAAQRSQGSWRPRLGMGAPMGRARHFAASREINQ